jgi:hypothetical protein
MAGYLPLSTDEIPVWSNNFTNKLLKKYKDLLSVTDTEIIEIENKTTSLLAKSKTLKEAEKALEDARQELKVSKKDVVDDITALVKRIRTRKTLTDAIASDLAIVATVTTVDFNNLKPEIKVNLVGNIPQYEYTKKGTTGVVVYCKRGAETDFIYLDKDLKTPYVDNRANLVKGTPELRTYKFRFFYNDIEVGNWSDEVSVTVSF